MDDGSGEKAAGDSGITLVKLDRRMADDSRKAMNVYELDQEVGVNRNVYDLDQQQSGVTVHSPVHEQSEYISKKQQHAQNSIMIEKEE